MFLAAPSNRTRRPEPTGLPRSGLKVQNNLTGPPCLLLRLMVWGRSGGSAETTKSCIGGVIFPFSSAQTLSPVGAGQVGLKVDELVEQGVLFPGRLLFVEGPHIRGLNLEVRRRQSLLLGRLA